MTDLQNTAAQLQSVVTQDQISLSEKVGAIKATAFIKKLVTVTEIKVLAEIKESKQYKGLQLSDTNGELVTVTTWEDFCKSLGHSREKVDQDILNLSTFGEEFLETSQRMGLGYRDLRKLRKLPEEDQSIIIDGEAVQAGDKEAVVELLEEVIAKHAKEKDAMKKELADTKADSEAKDQLIADKNKKLDNLDKKLTKQKTPNAQAKAQAEALEAAHGDMQQSSSNLLIAINEYVVSIATLQESFADVAEIAEQVSATVNFDFQRIAEIANKLNIAVDFEEKVTPAWMASAPDADTE